MKTLMRNGRDRRSENPFLGHAKKERVGLFGTDQRITSGPAARRPHSKAEYMTAPERFADSQIPLAPRAPSIHDPTGHRLDRNPAAQQSPAVLDVLSSSSRKHAEAAGAVKRREFITLLGGAAVAWPVAARGAAERADAAHRRAHALPRRRSGVAARIGAFRQGLQELGWTSRPQRPDRLSLGQATTIAFAVTWRRLLALAPDVIVARRNCRQCSRCMRGDTHCADRFRERRRSGRRRACREPGAAGRQRHRFHCFRIRRSARSGWSCLRRLRLAARASP